jgi:cyclophilin family peptidyl-prolyl cis-trans isomerase
MKTSLSIVVCVVIIGLVGWYLISSKESPTRTDSYSTSTPVSSLPSGNNPPISENVPKIDTGVTTTNTKTVNIVTIETNKGKIVIETFASDAPKTVENFTTLAGKGYYDGVIFHRVIQGFMIQGGDPTGTGRGGPGYTFADELNPATESYKRGYVRGTVAMANAGKNTNGSQFFIMHADVPLPHDYTIFGRVIEGIEVVDAIANSQTDASDRPLEKIEMKKVTVGSR